VLLLISDLLNAECLMLMLDVGVGVLDLDVVIDV